MFFLLGETTIDTDLAASGVRRERADMKRNLVRLKTTKKAQN